MIEADRVGHEVLEPGGAAHPEVVARWPEVVEDGVIDRRSLGRIVFADPTELADLEAITHPHIRRIVHDRVDAADGLVLVEVPVPVRWLPDEWPRVVVDVPDGQRVARLLGRGMDRLEIEQRMAAQPSREEWRTLADHLVDNGGSLDDLEAALDALLAAI